MVSCLLSPLAVNLAALYICMAIANLVSGAAMFDPVSCAVPGNGQVLMMTFSALVSAALPKV